MGFEEQDTRRMSTWPRYEVVTELYSVRFPQRSQAWKLDILSVPDAFRYSIDRLAEHQHLGAHYKKVYQLSVQGA